MSTTVRIRENSRDQLRELQRLTGEGATEVLARAIDSFRRSLILAETDIAYGAMRVAGSAASAELDAERADWDETLSDGLDE